MDRRSFLAALAAAPAAAAVSPDFKLVDVTRQAGIQFVHNSGAFGRKYLRHSKRKIPDRRNIKRPVHHLAISDHESEIEFPDDPQQYDAYRVGNCGLKRDQDDFILNKSV